MKKNIWSFLGHIAVFVGIEILFVFVILHEFPQISLLGMVGIIHVAYWVLLIVAGIIREKVKKYRQKFLADYIPVVLHIIGHIYITIVTVESVVEHDNGHEHTVAWMIIATLALGILIFLGERLLHKKEHCDHCHAETHKHCIEE